jgi:hypothetical protein
MSVTSDQWMNGRTWDMQQMDISCFDMSLKILKYILRGSNYQIFLYAIFFLQNRLMKSVFLPLFWYSVNVYFTFCFSRELLLK